jgi:hypothetical protein
MMQRQWIAIVTLLLLCGCMEAQENLLTTGGFEEAADGVPAGWSFLLEGGSEGTCALDSETVRSGQHSVRIEKTSGPGFITLTTSPKIAITAGEEYEVRAFYRTTDVPYAANAYFCIRQYQEDGTSGIAPNIFGPSAQRVVNCLPGEWQMLSSVLTARPEAAFLEVALVVNGNPFTINFDDLYIGPPIPPDYRPPALTPEVLVSEEEVFARLAERENATGEVRTINGQPTLLISGEPTPPMLYLMCFWRPEGSYNGDFGRAGMHVQVCPIIFSPYRADGAHLWTGRGEYDFAKADEVLMYALRANPDAYIVPDIVLLGAYPGWGDEHPDEVAQDINGNLAIGKSVHNIRYGTSLADESEFWCPSLYSQLFREDGAQLIRDYIAHLRETPLWKAVVGFTITGGDDGQFSAYRRSGPAHEPDYSPTAQRDFARLLREWYADDEAALREAWNDPQVTFDTVELPTPEERIAAGSTFRDPATDTRIADHARFLSEGTCDTVRALAGAAKDAAGKPVFTTTYWGAHVMGSSLNHFGSRRLMRTPEIDIIHAPAGYGPWRRPGQPGCNHTTPGSLRLHDKLCLQELDLRTFTKGYPDEASRQFLAWAADREEFEAINRREMGLMMAWGMGSWYYDMAGGWFHDEGIMADIADVHEGYREGLADVTAWHPDFAVFADEESSHWVPEGMRTVIFTSLNRQRVALNTSGVPYDRYLTDDLTHPDMPDYRVYLFLNAYRLTDERIDAINALKRDGKTLVFMYAPGFISSEGLSIDRASELVGMPLQWSPEAVSLQCEAVPGDHPLAEGLLPVQEGARAAKFWVDDPEAIVLGRYADEGEAAIAARDFGAWRSVYVAIPGGINPELLNNIARWSGAYAATAPGDAVYMNGRLLCVHGLAGGTKQITLPFRATVTEELTGEVLARDVESLTLDVPLQRTLWLRLDR